MQWSGHKAVLFMSTVLDEVVKWVCSIGNLDFASRNDVISEDVTCSELFQARHSQDTPNFTFAITQFSACTAMASSTTGITKG